MSGEERQYLANPDVVSCELDGGQALLNLKTSLYYSLNDTGAVIWQRIATPAGLDAVAEAMMAKFDVDMDRCRADAERMLSAMVEADLVSMVDAPAA